MQARPVHCGAPTGSAAVHDGREERDGQVAPRPAAVSTGECGGGGGAVDPAFYSRAWCSLLCVSPSLFTAPRSMYACTQAHVPAAPRHPRAQGDERRGNGKDARAHVTPMQGRM